MAPSVVLHDRREHVEELAEAPRRARAALLLARLVDERADAVGIGLGELLHEAREVRGIGEELLAPALGDVEERGLALRRRLDRGELLDHRARVDVAHDPADVLDLPTPRLVARD